MKISQRTDSNEAAFTVAEMVVATAVMTLLGLVLLQVLNSGFVLYAKNTAVNVAHKEAREGILRMTRDIHASISVPQLRTANAATLAPTDTTSIASSLPASGATTAPMAPGVSFQTVAFGPQFVWRDPNGNGPIMVKGGPNNTAPSEGMQVVAPFFGVEDAIIKVTAVPQQASHHNIWLKNGGETLMANKVSLFGTPGATYSILYYTNRVMYLVQNGTYVADSQGPFVLSGTTYIPYTSGSMQRYRYENGELHFYTQVYANNALSWKDQGVVARNISSPTPFYVPFVASATGLWYESTSSYLSYATSSANSTGNRFTASANNKYVGVKLSARDPKTTNRGYLATASLLDTEIDYRSRIAVTQ
jgi:hypothetical protein